MHPIGCCWWLLLVPIHNGAQAQLCFVDPCSALFHDISVGSKAYLLQRSASPVHLRLASTRFTLQRPMMSASGSQNIFPFSAQLESGMGPCVWASNLLWASCLPVGLACLPWQGMLSVLLALVLIQVSFANGGPSTVQVCWCWCFAAASANTLSGARPCALLAKWSVWPRRLGHN